MKDLELTYMTQVKNHEKRASGATVSEAKNSVVDM